MTCLIVEMVNTVTKEVKQLGQGRPKELGTVYSSPSAAKHAMTRFLAAWIDSGTPLVWKLEVKKETTANLRRRLPSCQTPLRLPFSRTW